MGPGILGRSSINVKATHIVLPLGLLVATGHLSKQSRCCEQTHKPQPFHLLTQPIYVALS